MIEQDKYPVGTKYQIRDRLLYVKYKVRGHEMYQKMSEESIK